MGNSDTGNMLKIIGLLLFLVPFFVVPLTMMQGPGSMAFVPVAFIIAVFGFMLMIVGGIISGESGFPHHRYGRQRVPPVQYPQETETQQIRGLVEEITCPDCGASPKKIEYHGITTCEYCGTKYKVR